MQARHHDLFYSQKENCHFWGKSLTSKSENFSIFLGGILFLPSPENKPSLSAVPFCVSIFKHPWSSHFGATVTRSCWDFIREIRAFNCLCMWPSDSSNSVGPTSKLGRRLGSQAHTEPVAQMSLWINHLSLSRFFICKMAFWCYWVRMTWAGKHANIFNTKMTLECTGVVYPLEMRWLKWYTIPYKVY